MSLFLSKFFIISFFLLIPMYLYSVSKIQIEIALEDFYSNLTYQSNLLALSNQYDETINFSNELLINLLITNTDYLAKTPDRLFKFYAKAANYHYLHLGKNKNKEIAFELWQKLIDLDFQALKKKISLDEKNKLKYKRYNTPFNLEEIETAFRMMQYLYLTKNSFDLSTQTSQQRFFNSIFVYISYIEKGLQYSKQMLINAFLYLIDKEEIKKADNLYQTMSKKGIHDSFYKDLLENRKLYFREQFYSNHQKKYKEELDEYYNRQLSLLSNTIPSPLYRYYNLATSIIKTVVPDNFEKVQTMVLPIRRDLISKGDKVIIRKAIDYYLLSIEYDPSFYPSLHNLGILYAYIQNNYKAIFFLKKALNIKTSFQILYALGLTYMALKEYQKAYSFFQEAFILEPQNYALLNNLAHCSIFYKDPQLVRPTLFYINKLLKLDPFNYLWVETKSDIYFHKKDYKNAIFFLKKALFYLNDVNINKNSTQKYLNLFRMYKVDEDLIPYLKEESKRMSDKLQQYQQVFSQLEKK